MPAIWRVEDNPSVVITAIPDQVVSPISDVIEGSTRLADEETQAGRHLVLATGSGRHRLLVTRSVAVPVYVLPVDGTAAVHWAATDAFHAGTIGYALSRHCVPLRPSPYQRHRLALLLAILDRFDDQSREMPTLAAAFALLAAGSGNRQLVEFVRRIGERLHAIRRREPEIVPAATQTLESIEASMHASAAERRDVIWHYHRQCAAHAASLIDSVAK